MKSSNNENNTDGISENDTDAAEDVSGAAACCRTRKKERAAEEYKSLVNRLNRIEGQIRGIRKMVENDIYCADILVQSAAVSAAINAFNRELLADHIRTCVADDMREGRDEVIDELLALIRKLMK